MGVCNFKKLAKNEYVLTVRTAIYIPIFAWRKQFKQSIIGLMKYDTYIKYKEHFGEFCLEHFNAKKLKNGIKSAESLL